MQSPLATTDWLQDHLDDSDLRIIELRGQVLPPTEPPPHYFSDRAGWEAAHIPGSVYVDWLVDINEPGSPSNDIASPARFTELMRSLGVSGETRVIIADDAANMFATRLRWALRHYGHDDVYILDGGWTKWQAEGKATNGEIARYARGDFQARVAPRLMATADDILRGMESDAMQIIDVRSPAEYSGAASRAKVGGHIPGAINLPRKALVADDMTMKTADELRQVFADKGIALDAADTTLYCNSGVSATYGMLALEVAGASNLRIYDGSWKEWGNDPAKPKATKP